LPLKAAPGEISELTPSMISAASRAVAGETASTL
jgi:hypothetical protein